MYCCVLEVESELLAGVTVMLESEALETVTVVVPAMDPELAVMFAVPNPELLASPLLLTVATVASEVLQVTVDVMSCELPSA